MWIQKVAHRNDLRLLAVVLNDRHSLVVVDFATFLDALEVVVLPAASFAPLQQTLLHLLLRGLEEKHCACFADLGML